MSTARHTHVGLRGCIGRTAEAALEVWASDLTWPPRVKPHHRRSSIGLRVMDGRAIGAAPGDWDSSRMWPLRLKCRRRRAEHGLHCTGGRRRHESGHLHGGHLHGVGRRRFRNGTRSRGRRATSEVGLTTDSGHARQPLVIVGSPSGVVVTLSRARWIAGGRWIAPPNYRALRRPVQVARRGDAGERSLLGRAEEPFERDTRRLGDSNALVAPDGGIPRLGNDSSMAAPFGTAPPATCFWVAPRRWPTALGSWVTKYYWRRRLADG